MELLGMLMAIIWLSLKWGQAKREYCRKLEEERIIREMETRRREKEAQEQQRIEEYQAHYRLSCISSIFSTDPWQKWVTIDHNNSPQASRIRRAYETSSMRILSYCPADSSAVIQGESWMRYKTTPVFCECPDFSERGLPCKHMYFLARKLFDGFDADTTVGEQHSCLSTAERKRQEKWLENKRFIESGIPHKNILSYVKIHGPLTRRQIVEAFSVLDEKDVKRAISQLYQYGLINGEKRSGRYIHWVDNKDDTE